MRYITSMQIAIVCLLALLIVLGILILLKLSKKDPQASAVQAQLGVISGRLDEISRTNVLVAQTADQRLKEIRADNEKRLEEIRQTVDEKLQKTLENRLSVTFRTVSEQLESVYKQLGEMKSLAKGVDNLEKVLTNVKTRGMWGELQAERILQEILTPEQYVKNVATKPGSHDVVEFAIRLPGPDEGSVVLMPIDSKFPREDYERLCQATERGDLAEATQCRAALERRVKAEAKSIREKYIEVPYTTEFAILFLPIEGLYAEVLSVPGLQDLLQREYRVMVAGPATLASLLNSLQMGFRTLAIEKKSAEVWNILGQVKTQFGKFEDILVKVQNKLKSASNDVEEVFTRQRVMSRKLKNVEAIEVIEADEAVLGDDDE